VGLAPSQPPTATDIQGIFNRIAPVYDDLNQRLSFGLHRIWKRMAISWSDAKEGDTCLDICCGSGDLALMLADQVGPTGTIYGVDFSEDQLAVARRRSQQKGFSDRIQWILGDALAIPCEDATFDAATMGYGLRNLTDISRGLAELQRVLKPGATAAILDFHQPQNPLMQQFQQWYLDKIVVPAARDLGLKQEYAYIAPSLDRFPSGREQVALARQVGFQSAVHYTLAGGVMGVPVVRRSDELV
jgi:demethylmenaquinone methyltransferase/2-methoxy-6-polyprenyl-1,4-benzoquinol methylase